MCGIVGSINCVTDTNSLSLIAHRGPDRRELAELKAGVHKIYFGHARLSIVDLSPAGNQPMYSDCGNYCIIYNGEIYNHEQLKQKLGHINFRGHSDTETILYYFREFGIESVKELNGIFAIAYLDLKEKKLHLVRDRFGIKPLYYHSSNNQLLFSSEIRTIKALKQPVVNKGILLNALKMRYTPSPFTIYNTIEKAEPGQCITCSMDSDKITINKQYFLSAAPIIGTRKDNNEKLLQQYGDLFEKAVERQLMADVEVGILLSGGVDSALVAAVAKHKSKSPVKAFTIGFEGSHPDVDEIDYAKQTASVLGIQHFYKQVGISDLFQSFRKIARIVEEPIGTTSIIPMYYLAELAASHVKVVLSGQGADEPLGGYAKYRYLHLIDKAKLLRPVHSIGKKLDFLYSKNEKSRRLMSAAFSGDPISAYAAYNAVFSDKEITGLINPALQKTAMDDMCRIQKQVFAIWKNRMSALTSAKNAYPYYDLRTSLADDLLMYTDKITMNFGLECRVPLLDNELVEFIESLETRYKFNSKTGKIIHKQFAQAYLPAEIVNRKKLGFQSPTDHWFRQHRHDIEKILCSGKLLTDFFDQKAIKNLLSEHAGGQNREKQIFLLLSIFYLLEEVHEH